MIHSVLRILVVFLLMSVCAQAEVLTVPQISYNRCKDEREPGACYELADLYMHTSKPGDIALGAQFLRYGCKLELKKKCSEAEAQARSSAYLKAKKDWDATKQKSLSDMVKVKIKSEVACESGSAKDCSQAGVHYFFLAPTLNPAKGKAMFQEGCRLKDQSSCKSLDLIEKGITRVYDVEM